MWKKVSSSNQKNRYLDRDQSAKNHNNAQKRKTSKWVLVENKSSHRIIFSIR